MMHLSCSCHCDVIWVFGLVRFVFTFGFDQIHKCIEIKMFYVNLMFHENHS